MQLHARRVILTHIHRILQARVYRAFITRFGVFGQAIRYGGYGIAHLNRISSLDTDRTGSIRRAPIATFLTGRQADHETDRKQNPIPHSLYTHQAILCWVEFCTLTYTEIAYLRWETNWFLIDLMIDNQFVI